MADFDTKTVNTETINHGQGKNTLYPRTNMAPNSSMS